MLKKLMTDRHRRAIVSVSPTVEPFGQEVSA